MACGLLALFLAAVPARAADRRLELGTTLVSAGFGFDGLDAKTFGIPSGGLLGIGTPGVFGSIFLNDRISVEPQVRLFVIASDDDTDHVVAFNGQANYFLKGAAVNSPFVFGKAGFVDFSDDDSTPKVFGAGAGYRMPMGRLVFRFDGQFLHYTDDVGNAVVFGVSIGGVFGM